MPTPKPIYMKPWFRVTTLLVAVVAIAGAVLLATQKFPVIDSEKVPTGKIEVTTVPPGATIVMDGTELKQKSNTTFKARAGERMVRLKLNGYDEEEVKVLVEDSDQPYKLAHAFTKQGLAVQSTSEPLRTYRNEKFGYSVQYPSDWRVEVDPSGIPHFYNALVAKQLDEPAGEGELHNHAAEQESMIILPQDNPQNLSPEAWYKARPEYAMEDQAQIKQSNQTFGGRPAYQYDSPYGFVPYLTTIFTGKGQAFLFQQKSGSPDREIYARIVESFRL